MRLQLLLVSLRGTHMRQSAACQRLQSRAEQSDLMGIWRKRSQAEGGCLIACLIPALDDLAIIEVLHSILTLLYSPQTCATRLIARRLVTLLCATRIVRTTSGMSKPRPELDRSTEEIRSLLLSYSSASGQTSLCPERLHTQDVICPVLTTFSIHATPLFARYTTDVSKCV